jgi:Protein of unknown function (DUF1587)
MMAHVLELAKQDTQITSPGLRRLNKREYGNTVRDLLGLHKGIFDPREYIYVDGPFFDEWPPESLKTTYDSGEIPDLSDPSQRLHALGRFAQRAFRRNVTREEMEPWSDFMNS